MFIDYNSGFQPYLYYGTPKLFVAPRGTLLKSNHDLLVRYELN